MKSPYKSKYGFEIDVSEKINSIYEILMEDGSKITLYATSEDACAHDLSMTCQKGSNDFKVDLDPERLTGMYDVMMEFARNVFRGKANEKSSSKEGSRNDGGKIKSWDNDHLYRK
jgi:hypothetical protein